MAAITPSTNLFLLKNTNNLSKQNQLTFANATAQHNYFNSLTKLEVDNFTYQRKDYVIRYPACVDDILDYNYVMYQNSAFGNKWFYAYIKNMRYISNTMTEITIETDVYQTYMFDITFMPSFVEREHVNDDTVGKHTIPEGLETGEYVCNASDSLLFNDYCYMMQVSETAITGTKLYAVNINGIWMSGGFYVFDSVASMVSVMNAITKEGVIKNIYIVPKYLLGSVTMNTYLEGQATTPIYTSKVIARPTTIDTYTPKNNKLKCYPYQYLLETNNNGASTIFKYELFPSTISFSIGGCATVGGSIISIPTDYGEGDETSMLIAGKFPTCSWSEDAYTNWLTMNGVNIAGVELNAEQAGVALGIGEIAIGLGSIAAGNPYGVGGVLGGIGSIASVMQESYRHKLIPDSFKGNINGGDFLTAAGRNGFYFYKMSIKKEIAASIDNYFSMFGYKVNIVKTPNLTGRTYWNYVKTIGANIEGLIPEFYMDELKAMFNAGITLWHDPTKFLDYSQNNAIVS